MIKKKNKKKMTPLASKKKEFKKLNLNPRRSLPDRRRKKKRKRKRRRIRRRRRKRMRRRMRKRRKRRKRGEMWTLLSSTRLSTRSRVE